MEGACAEHDDTRESMLKGLAYDASKDLTRKNVIYARLEVHEVRYPQLRLYILEAGELCDFRASEFFWCAPPHEFREKVSQILSAALRDVVDDREVHSRLDHFLVSPSSQIGHPEVTALSAALLRLDVQLMAGKELSRCSTISGIPLETINGKLAIVEEFTALKYPPKQTQTRDDRKKFIISRLAPLSLAETRDFAQNLRLNVRLNVGGHACRTLADIRNDIAVALVSCEQEDDQTNAK